MAYLALAEGHLPSLATALLLKLSPFHLIHDQGIRTVCKECLANARCYDALDTLRNPFHNRRYCWVGASTDPRFEVSETLKVMSKVSRENCNAQ